ncbi:hypothetical protein [Metabacillus idriensis]|uniref:hypothetical protein n=1 Tax=Metabacillus idriensis TaxID=324768 RepID=UPI001748C587|nr:hypothetical protein [Metabacillus idriensis]
MNINERLQEIERIFKYSEHEKLILDTVKQLQEENEKLENHKRHWKECSNIHETRHQKTLRLLQESRGKTEELQKRIEDLENENRTLREAFESQTSAHRKDISHLSQITAAHEAFLKELRNAIVIMEFNTTANLTLRQTLKTYNQHFEFIHLEEQVHQSIIIAGCGKKAPYMDLDD